MRQLTSLDSQFLALALARPGSDAQVARIVARPLGRARPLWELYLIHGLRSGHTAMPPTGWASTSRS